jgi:hypothetical protein
MKKTGDPRPMAVWLLIVLQFLLGLGALGGGGVLIAAPDGSIIQIPLSILEFSPFHNFLIPGIILFTSLGLFPIAIAYSLWQLPAWRWPDFLNPFRGMHWSWAASLAAGVILLIWITVEVLMLRSVEFLQVFYFTWGCLLILLTLTASVRQYCTRSER